MFCNVFFRILMPLKLNWSHAWPRWASRCCPSSPARPHRPHSQTPVTPNLRQGLFLWELHDNGFSLSPNQIQHKNLPLWSMSLSFSKDMHMCKCERMHTDNPHALCSCYCCRTPVCPDSRNVAVHHHRSLYTSPPARHLQCRVTPISKHILIIKTRSLT